MPRVRCSVHARIAKMVALAFASLLLVAACACAPKPTLQSTWPVASIEATVPPPSDALHFPLTGRSATDLAEVARRPLCVKIANKTGTAGLLGVQAADVVYETADSGVATQLDCLFQSAVPKSMAPIGLAGMPDLWIAPQYGAALFSAGAPASLSASIVQAGILDFSQDTTAASAYRRVGGDYVLSGPGALSALTVARSLMATQTARLRFSADEENTSTPISSVAIPFSPTNVVSWNYLPKRRAYRRSENGRVTQMTASNVVVMWAHYTPLDADIAGAGGFDVTLGGSGQVSVFRDGQRLDGKWKADGVSPPRFVAGDGSPIALGPGNTWIEVIPLAANITLR